MGKFSRNREYTFTSLEEIIAEIVEHFDEGMDIDIVLAWEETQEFITALISTGKFIPYSLDYSHFDMSNYNYEYQISITHSEDGNLLFVEPKYSIERGKYTEDILEPIGIVFISMGVSLALYKKFVSEGFNTVLFDINSTN